MRAPLLGPWLLPLLCACATPTIPLTENGGLVGPATTSFAPPPASAGTLDFTLQRYPEGTPYRLSSDRGSVVLLDVWATWCDACRDSLPLYEDLARQFGARGLKVYAISVDADQHLITPFLEQLKVHLNVLADPGARLSEVELKVKAMPTSMLIDRHGVVRATHEGFSEELLAQYLDEIDALLKEP
jgi:thiol-disulfide isomerase/thioredoxin